MGVHRDVWTTWLNVDKPWLGDGDYETVSAIEQHYGQICESGYRIASAECRVQGAPDSDVFTVATEPDTLSDVFKMRCTKEGLICRNQDQQPFGKMCEDYAIRFRCQYVADDNSDAFFPQFDVRIYIILAVVPILIFLVRILWAYVFRRRRQRRREERRARQRLARGGGNGDDLDDDTSSIASGLANPPPSYQELFGEPGNYAARSSVFAISGANIPVCAKCESKPCSVALAVSSVRQSQENSENGNQTEEHAVRATALDGVSVELEMDITTNSSSTTNEQAAEGSSAVVPANCMVGDDTERTPVPSYQDSITSSSSPSSTEASSHQFTEIDLGDPLPAQDDAPEASPVHTNTLQIDNEEQSQPRRESAESPVSEMTSSSSNVSNAESQSPSPLLPLSISSSFMQAKSSISQPCACTCHRTIPFQHQRGNGVDNPGYTSENDDTDAQMRPSYPGMHMPVPGIHRVYSSSSIVTLSELPSYEDALELMKKKKKEAESLQS